MASVPRKTIEIFFSYSHKDQRLRDQLDTQLSLMTREGLISSWFDHKITAGNEWAGKIDDHLNKSQVILLLISPDFIASDYCYDIEMKRAMARHEVGEARVIPIILRPCDWHKAPFSKLKALPTDGKPVNTWTNRDRAFLDIATGIRKVIEELATQSVIVPKINKQTIVSSASKKIGVLLVFANPQNTDSLRLGTEDRVIHEAIQLSPYRDRISITVQHASTIHDLRRVLLANEFQIVHLSGHGGEKGLILEDATGKVQFIPQTALADLFQAYSSSIQCVILNACYSISQGQLTSLGVPFTIAMEGSISDKAAIEFSRGFYDAIGAGKAIDVAYEEGCRTVKLAAPRAPFVSQLLVNDDVPKHVLLNPNDPLPPGYISIVKEKEGRTIALKPTLFQSLEALLDDLYLSYLSNQYEPDTYGSSWILASRTDLFQRLIAPWNWLLPVNRNKPTSLYSQGWQSLSPETYGLTANTTWEIINPSALSAFGLVTNEKRVADYSSSIQGSKSLYRLLSLTFHTHHVKRVFPFFNANLFSRVVPPETIKPDDYRYAFIFTAFAASLKDGRAIILDK